MLRRLIAFLRPGIFGTLASVVGIGAGLNSLFGGGGGQGGNSGGGTYVPTGRPQIDQSFLTAIAPLLKMIQQEADNITGPVNYGYASDIPGGQFGNLPTTLQGFGNAIINSAAQDQANQSALSQAGNQVFQTALDPQNALRNQLQQQVTDASRAGTSARGIGMGGEAAGIENQDVNNFLLNWQNAQLQRQLAGLGGMSQAMGQSGNLGAQAGQSLGQSANFYNTGALFPFEMAGAYSNALGAPMSQFGNLSPQMLSYLGLGNQAGQQAFNNQNTGLGQIINAFNSLVQQQQQPPAPISDQSTSAGSGYGP